jgi:hypothetical protein
MGLFCVCVVLCLDRGLATSWSPIQGVLPSVKWSMKLRNHPCAPKWERDGENRQKDVKWKYVIMEITNQTPSFKQQREFEWTELMDYWRNAPKSVNLRPMKDMRFSRLWLWRNQSSGMWHRVDIVLTGFFGGTYGLHLQHRRKIEENPKAKNQRDQVLTDFYVPWVCTATRSASTWNTKTKVKQYFNSRHIYWPI